MCWWQTVAVAAGGGSSITASPWPGLLLIFVFGPLFGGLGLAMATDFRGFTEWHVRKTMQMMRPAEGPLSRVPPWKQMLRKPREDRIQQQIKAERRMGVVFASLGGLMMLGGVVVFLAWLL